ncbi:reverse transcriptase domain-containing protein [Aurantiacibacter sp. MUD61]|uniref:reverse transcriptase domain-containing protein n=1 Tax=Aurantiacibacter sp. MUD61 TaxID=3009083 RepID=UPI0022F0AFBE|nr:reverse transcriptase domain-containing protein [Aurantiacibacter sp. MUD61]
MLTGRGRSAVCEYLRQEVPNLSADHVFMQVDVKDFFGSISSAWIEGRFRLAEAIIRRQMHSGEMRILMDRRARAYLPGGELNERVRRVLPQGSALSPLVAEMAMAEVLEGLADHLRCTLVVTYSDNLGIFLPAAQAAAIEDCLRNAFGVSGVGPFELTFSRPIPIADGFSFLGHIWKLEAGELHTFVDEQVANMRAIVLRTQLLNCLTHNDLSRVRSRIFGQANEWKFWPGIAAWKSGLLLDLERAREGLAARSAADCLAA